jgi:uncharacterized membrane protein
MKTADLWAVGFDATERASQVRDEVEKLAERHCLVLLDFAVAVRYPDGTLTLDGEPFRAPAPLHGRGLAGFFAALALGAPPLTAAAAGSLIRGTGDVPSTRAGIGEDFVSDVGRLMNPGTSALFVLGQAGDSEALLQGIRGLGGALLKTDVDPEWARQVQAALSSAAADRR